MFSDSIYAIAQRVGQENIIDEIKKDLINHDKFYIFKTSLSSELNGCHELKKLFGYNALKFIQLLLHRSKALIEGSIIALNNKNILTFLIAVRAHFETTGSIAFLLKGLISYYGGNIDFQRIDDELLRLSLGATTIKITDVGESIKPINVLNMIDATDYLMKKSVFAGKPPNDKMFRTFYEELSDFYHPNFQGTTFGSDIINEEMSVVYHKTDKLDERNLTGLPHMAMSSSLFLHFYGIIRGLLEEKEIMPIIQVNK